MVFGSPLYGLLLLPVLAVWAWWVWRGGNPRRLPAIALAVLLLAGGLMAPRWGAPSDVVHVALLVDRSDSVRAVEQGEMDHASLAAAELRGKLLPADRVLLMGFGRTPAVVQPLAPLRDPSPALFAQAEIDPGASDPGAALSAAADRLPPDSDVILITDGRENLGDVRTARARLTLKGIRLWIVPTAPAPRGDCAVLTLAGPVSLPAGARAELSARVSARTEGWVTVTFTVQGRPFPKCRRRVFFSLGETRTVTVSTEPLPKGLVTARVEIRAGSSPDPVPSNDAMELPLRVGAEKTVLYAVPEARAGVFGKRLQGLAGLSVETLPPYALPRRPDRLSRFDAIVLDAVPREKLTRPQMESIQAFVMQGGGLLLLGGEGGFGPGGHYDTPLEEISPVRSDPKDAKPLALLVLLDVSGSMAGTTSEGGSKLDLALDAVESLARRLRTHDRLTVLPFSSRTHAGSAATARGDDPESIRMMMSSLSAIQAGGETSIFKALAAAAADPPGDDKAVRHVLLYSDGMETLPAGDYPSLLKDLDRARATLSTVITGPAPDGALLAALTENLVRNGRLYTVARFEDLKGYFLKDLSQRSRDLIRHGRLRVQVRGSGFKDLDPPPVDRLVRTGLREREGARLDLALEDGDPVLAHWRRGLGSVWAFTSSLDGNWAQDWLVKRKGMPELWSPVVSDLVRPRGGERIVNLSERDGVLRVDLELREDGRNRNGLDLTAKVFRDLTPVEGFPIDQTGPGRYQGSTPVGQLGHYRVVVLEASGRGRRIGEGEMVVRGSGELRRLGPDLPTLTALAGGEGGVLSDLSRFQRPGHSRVQGRGKDVSWIFYLGALAAFLIHLLALERRRGAVPHREPFRSKD